MKPVLAMHGFLWLVASLASLVSFGLTATSVYAEEIFSNYGAGNATCACNNSYSVGAHPLDPPQSFAVPFTVPVSSSFTLDTINMTAFTTCAVADCSTRPTAVLVLKVVSDSGGRPGTTLESFTFNSLAGTTFWSPAFLTGRSSGHPLLVAGRQYWVVADVTSPTTMTAGLNINGQGAIGLQAYRQANQSWTLLNQAKMALRVTATRSSAAPPAANFSWTPSPKVGQEVQFTDTSTGNATAWEWSFGDGGTSASQNPRHAFASATSYSVKLTASNAAGSNATTKTVVVDAAPLAPVANFTWTSTPKAGQEVQFTDTSTGGPTSWTWTFGDGGTSSSASPKHVFAVAGTYNVKLTAINAVGSHSATKSVAIAAGSNAPNANFTWLPASPTAGQDVQFSDTSTGAPSAWSWTFGDGGTSASRNPKHKFAANGAYNVKLTATNAAGADSTIKRVTVVQNTHPLTIALIDPEPDWPLGQVLPTSPGALEGRGAACRGAATDGVTRLLVRAETVAPASVTFALVGSTADFSGGSLFELGSSGSVGSLTVATTALPTGKHVAYCVYKVPPVFPASGGSESTTALRASAVGAGAAGELTTNVILIRPPLILLHGMRSSGSTWDARPFESRYKISQSRSGTLRTLFTPTYDGTESFYYNRAVVSFNIRMALSTVRENGFAARRVDLIGHSMGGLLARQWAGADGLYFDTIYRLITMNSPHKGSPWVKFLTPATSSITYVWNLLGLDFYPAISNLSSDQISLPAARVWTHLIAGVDGMDEAARNACWDRTDHSLSLLQWLANRELGVLLADVFGSEQNDVIVSVSSQLGAVSRNASYVTLINGPDGVHTCNTTSLAYANRAIQLLNTDPTRGEFVSVLAGVNEFTSPDHRQLAQTWGNAVDERLQIVAPSAGTIFAPGQSIEVELAVTGLTVQSVAFVTNADVHIDEAAPFGATLKATTEKLGSTEIVALARLSDGSLAMSAPLPIEVRTGTPFASLSVEPNSDLVLRVGDQSRIEVRGMLAGATESVMLDTKDLTTTYSTPGIAQIEGGVLMAKKVGNVTIVLRRDAAECELRVAVVESPSSRRRPARH